MMSLNRLPLSQTAFIAATSTLILLLAGCQAATAPTDRSVSNDSSLHAESAETPDTPQKTYSEKAQLPAVEVPNANPADLSNDANAAASDPDKSVASKAVVETASEKTSWNAAAPKLHTLAIGQSAAAVLESLGEEMDSYMLDDADDRIQVLEYDGFAVGLNGRKTVQYVEVYSDRLSPASAV